MLSYHYRNKLAIRTAHGWLPSSSSYTAFRSLKFAGLNNEPVTDVLVNGVRLTERSIRTLNAFLRYDSLKFHSYQTTWEEFAEWIDLQTMNPCESSPLQDEMTWTDAPVWLREIRDVESHRVLQNTSLEI